MSSRTALTTQRLAQVLCHFPKSVALKSQGSQLLHLRTMMNTRKDTEREKVVVVGTGWAGWTLSQDLDDKKFDITVISPERTLALTPLLASAACGIFDFR